MSSLVRKALSLLVLLSVSGSVLAGGADQARQLLEKMAIAMNQLTYQGTFVYVRDGVVDTMRITHVNEGGSVKERLYSTSGPQREVIRDKEGVRCILKNAGSIEENPIISDSYFPELPASLFESDASGYRLETGGKARIAGQTARRVSISAEDDFRYSYDFWLQEDTGLLLKWVLLDVNHKALAKLMFTDFSIGDDVKLGELVSDSSPADFIALSKSGIDSGTVMRSTPRWQPNKLPAGFKLTSHTREKGENGVVVHLVYSDGLAAVSIYVERRSNQPEDRTEVNQLGTNNAYSKIQSGLQVTVIGEVPAKTVKTIANEMALSIAAN